MKQGFPGAVPEVPVSNVDVAAEYYKSRFGFSKDWGGEDGGIAQVSKGNCRIFLTNHAFREQHGNAAPVLIWLNLNSKTKLITCTRRGAAATHELFLSQSRNPGSCMNSRPRIWMAICFAFSTTLPGNWLIADHKAAQSVGVVPTPNELRIVVARVFEPRQQS